MAPALAGDDRESVERDARFHRIGAWVVFAALLLSAFLPARYSLFAFAFPFGMIATAIYYVRFESIANIQNGLIFLSIIIALQSFTILQARFDRTDTYGKIEKVACRSDFASRAGEGLCDEVYSILNPEPAEDPE